MVNSDGSNYVRSSMFDRPKPKNGVRVRLRKDEHGFCPFDVRKNDVRVCSIIDLVNLVKAC